MPSSVSISSAQQYFLQSLKQPTGGASKGTGQNPAQEATINEMIRESISVERTVGARGQKLNELV